MHITTLHTLTFSMRVEGNERQAAALQIIQQGATGFGLTASITAKPLPEGEDNLSRHSHVTVSCADRGDLEIYGERVQQALDFIGVEVLP